MGTLTQRYVVFRCSRFLLPILCLVNNVIVVPNLKPIGLHAIDQLRKLCCHAVCVCGEGGLMLLTVYFSYCTDFTLCRWDRGMVDLWV